MGWSLQNSGGQIGSRCMTTEVIVVFIWFRFSWLSSLFMWTQLNEKSGIMSIAPHRNVHETIKALWGQPALLLFFPGSRYFFLR
jgi:hypothetical protein